MWGLLRLVRSDRLGCKAYRLNYSPLHRVESGEIPVATAGDDVIEDATAGADVIEGATAADELHGDITQIDAAAIPAHDLLVSAVPRGGVTTTATAAQNSDCTEQLHRTTAAQNSGCTEQLHRTTAAQNSGCTEQLHITTAAQFNSTEWRGPHRPSQCQSLEVTQPCTPRRQQQVGGFPCQPFSAAGLQVGQWDYRD